MHARKGQQHPLDKSRQLQRRLYLAAKSSRGRRFHALFDRIHRPDILWRAWIEVRANGGAAGADGVTLEEVERQGVEQFLQLRYHFKKVRARRSGKLVPLMWPAPKAMKRVRSRIREQTERRGLRYPMEVMVAKLNPIVRGWRNTYRIGNSTRQFQALDRYLTMRLVKWLKARFKRKPARDCEALLQGSGIEYFYPRDMRSADLNAAGRR